MVYNEVLTTENLRALETSFIRCHDSKLVKAWVNIDNEILTFKLKDPKFRREIMREADQVLDYYEFLINKNPIAEVRYLRDSQKQQLTKVEFEEIIHYIEENTGRTFDQNKKTVKELLTLLDKLKNKKNGRKSNQ